MTNIALCQIDDVPEPGCKGLRLPASKNLEAALFVVKKAGNVYLYRNHCPHLGVALEWLPDQFLDRDNEFIQCSTHDALFRIEDGLCVSGPCTGESLQALPFRIEGKSIMINPENVDE